MFVEVAPRKICTAAAAFLYFLHADVFSLGPFSVLADYWRLSKSL